MTRGQKRTLCVCVVICYAYGVFVAYMSVGPFIQAAFGGLLWLVLGVALGDFMSRSRSTPTSDGEPHKLFMGRNR